MDINTILKNDTSHQSTNDITTPMELVREIVAALPDKVFFGGVKVLDPCVGFGNFLIGFQERARSLGITPVLTGTDINTERTSVARQLLPEAFIVDKDFMDLTGTFDVIITNPPYAKITNGMRASKNHSIYQDFILKAVDMLSPGGAMAFLVPSSWMSLSARHIVAERLTSMNMTRLDVGSAKKHFPKVGSSFSWFVCVKETPSITHVSGKHGKHVFDSRVALRDLRFIPLMPPDMSMRILHKLMSGPEKMNIETSSDLHATTKKHLLVSAQDDDHPYKVSHTKIQTRWSSRPHKYQDGVKVFICLSSSYETWVDSCGMTQSVAFVRCKDEDEASRVKEVLDSVPFKFAVHITRYGNFTCIKVLQLLSSGVSFSQEEFDYMKSII
jgi:hypothetical protein